MVIDPHRGWDFLLNAYINQKRNQRKGPNLFFLSNLLICRLFSEDFIFKTRKRKILKQWRSEMYKIYPILYVHIETVLQNIIFSFGFS